MTTTTTTSTHGEAMSAGELAVIEARLPIGGMFLGAHAHTDVTRLLAEVHRLRNTHNDDTTPPTGGDGRRT